MEKEDEENGIRVQRKCHAEIETAWWNDRKSSIGIIGAYNPLVGFDSQFPGRDCSAKQCLRHWFCQPICNVVVAPKEADIRNYFVTKSFSSRRNIKHHAFVICSRSFGYHIGE